MSLTSFLFLCTPSFLNSDRANNNCLTHRSGLHSQSTRLDLWFDKTPFIPINSQNIVLPFYTHSFRMARFAKQSYSPVSSWCARYSLRVVKFWGLYLSTPEMSCSMCAGLVSGLAQSEAGNVLPVVMLLSVVGCNTVNTLRL